MRRENDKWERPEKKKTFAVCPLNLLRASWSESSGIGGASWIIRDSRGRVPKHSRRSFSFVFTREIVELWALHWAIESMVSMGHDKIVFESSCLQARACILKQDTNRGPLELVGMIFDLLQRLQHWSLEHVVPTRNIVAQKIAISVTAERRYQSYIATGGPAWLEDLIDLEAKDGCLLH
ncbi:PREDICTED: uncharacterized protein LOC106303466 [Brassica oleracea var. oleracea]|uniref:uncharacterized protein LOC106303466 n=1 Tax=Brassica oleracea var. oleracea TaxID=109376 RepID=UPI0006A6A860|nr:PREDICTED: uncharacterized protein LOC106303466 [Brassica oleracea var. oleracea]